MKKMLQKIAAVLALVLALGTTFGSTALAETRHEEWFDFEKLYIRLAPGEEMKLHITSTRGVVIQVLDSTDHYTRVLYRGGDMDNNHDEWVTIICGANEKADRVRIVVYNGPMDEGRYDIITLTVVKDGGQTDGKPSVNAGKKIADDASTTDGTSQTSDNGAAAAQTAAAEVTKVEVPASSAVIGFSDGTLGTVATQKSSKVAMIYDGNGTALGSFSIVDNGHQTEFSVSGVSNGYVDCTAPNTTSRTFTFGISDTDQAILALKGIIGVNVNGTLFTF